MRKLFIKLFSFLLTKLIGSKILITKIEKDSNIRNHTIRELDLAGIKGSDIDNLMRKNVIDLINVFAAQGHSGFSSRICVDLFSKLSMFEIVSPLTLKEEEFGNSFDKEGNRQNLRASVLFTKDLGVGAKRIHNIDAYTKLVVKRSTLGEGIIKPYNGGSWSGAGVYLMSGNIATGMYFRNAYIKKEDVNRGKYVLPEVIQLPVTEVEIDIEDWYMFVDIEDPKYIDLISKYDLEYENFPRIRDKFITTITKNDFCKENPTF